MHFGTTFFALWCGALAVSAVVLWRIHRNGFAVVAAGLCCLAGLIAFVQHETDVRWQEATPVHLAESTDPAISLPGSQEITLTEPTGGRKGRLLRIANSGDRPAILTVPDSSERWEIPSQSTKEFRLLPK